jgi:hypothetical protein
MITRIINAIKNSIDDIIIKKVQAYTNMIGNDKANFFAKLSTQEPRIVIIPFHHIGHQTPLWPSTTATSTQHDGSLRNPK